MSVFQIVRLAQVHIGYTSLNFPYGYVIININLTPNYITNFYL